MSGSLHARTTAPTARRSSTHGGLSRQVSVLVYPGDLWSSGLDCCAGFPHSCPVSRRRADVGQAGAPAAVAPVRARARTAELDPGKRRPMIESEEETAGLWVVVGQGGPWMGSRVR